MLLCLAALSSIASPATVRAQQPRAPSNGNAAQADGTSPALRFAAAADETNDDLSAPSSRPAKRSVLEPSTANWLQDESSALVDDGASPDDLSPPDMLSPESAPPPEAMEVLPGQPGPRTLPSVQMSPSLHADPLGTIPKSKVRQQPMLRDSWLYRPFNFSIFEGGLFATPPIAPQFNTAVSYFTGFRFGWDFNTHFGGETRFGFSKVFLLDASRNTEVGYQQIFYFDSNLLIYPWGDTRWRPFLALGTGLADVLIVDNAGLRLHPGAFNMPMGFGIKYRYGPRVAFRADFRDNLTFSGAGGLRTLNNIEATGGIEIHFGGGTRRSYWPWNPSHHWW